MTPRASTGCITNIMLAAVVLILAAWALSQ
jgi:hypothetical protein